MRGRGRGRTYSIFFGLIMKHHLVHIAPVAVKARFCERERSLAGRAKSETPARTIAHCPVSISHIRLILGEGESDLHHGRPDFIHQ